MLSTNADCVSPIPAAIVRLNRWTIVLTVAVALMLRFAPLTTALFVVVALAACFGRRGSLIYRVGMRVLARADQPEGGEDPRLMRFNNALAALMLGGGQVAFALHAPLIGWSLCVLTALAASAALAGFCVGCVLFYQLKLNRWRLLGS
jgi:hypothetical protein